MGASPINRIDDYPQAILNKIDSIFELGAEHNIDFILFGGDMFESYNASTSVIRRTLEWFKGRDIPMISILGNHDLHGHTLNTFHRSAVSILDVADFVEIIDVSEKYGVRGLHYYTGLEEDMTKGNKTPSEKMQEVLAGDETIWAAHAMISTEELKFISRNILVENIQVAPHTKLVLSGDYHAGFPITKRDDGVIFANPGSLSRRNVAKENLIRDVQVALVEYEPYDFDGDIEIEYIKVKAQPAEEVFDLAAIQDKKDVKVGTLSYIEKLKNLEMSDTIDDLESEISKFAGEAGLDNEILDEILSRLYDLQT